MRKIGVLVSVLFLASSCGGGGGGGSSGSIVSTSSVGIESGPNVLSVVVDTGPTGTRPNINLPFVSVTICAPGTSSCQTIDHVLLDTGSYGLRIMASEVSPLLTLPQETDDVSGSPLAECLPFLSGYSWGAVRLADVTLATETATSVPIHLIGDSAFPTTPSSCSSQGAIAINSVATLGAKGILGVGPLKYDCGTGCSSSFNQYFICPSGTTCTSVSVNTPKQVANPVAMLPTDNNGVVVYFPAVSSGGAATVTGTMALGIGTRSNNSLGSATVLDVADGSALLQTTFNGTTLTTAFLDTGSNGLFFTYGMPLCTVARGFYCPSTTQGFTAVVRGATNGASASVTFNIANAETLFASQPTYTAFSNVGGRLSGYFDWGLPFHYGRKVFTAIEGQSTPGGTGPYIAF